MARLRSILMSAAAVAGALVAGPADAHEARWVQRPTAHGVGPTLARPDEAERGTAGPAAEAPSAPRRLVIRPDPAADWDGASLADVTKVLRSAAETLWQHVPERRLAPIRVRPKGGPIVLYDRGPGGAYRVRLDTGGTYWCQYAFQFAHEFGHILCRHEKHPDATMEHMDQSNMWFEESVCETASLFALRRMAEVWKTHPPYPNWRDFAPSLRSYAEDRLRAAPIPKGTTLAAWYRKHADRLREEPCDRPKNRVVAGVLLPMFEAAPDRWQAVRYLNAGARPEPRSFEEYLADWRRHCPARHRPFVRQVAEAFGIRLPADG